MAKKLRISLRKKPALHVTREAIRKKKVVYVILANKKLRYPYGKSRVAYIGTTKKGFGRIASSAASRAEKLLSLHGVNEFSVQVVSCQSRQSVQTWNKLERALLLGFRERFGEVPKANTQGKKIKEKDEFKYFTMSRIRHIIKELG